jgi:hypothetical protein
LIRSEEYLSSQQEAGTRPWQEAGEKREKREKGVSRAASSRLPTQTELFEKPFEFSLESV